MEAGAGAGVPIGNILPTALATCATGYIAANGAAVSRATYAALLTAMGKMYGVGNGSTTFNLPDYRGYFLRGWDNSAGIDPDAGTRTNRGDGTTGNNVGTKQGDAFGSPTHSQGAGTQIYGGPSMIAMAGDGTAGGTVGGTTYASGGNETRPKNINVLYCVKY
ncbi:MAG: tail fiber protein [Bdellovibrio sp.]|nr:tail fiber protein [Bdellovibrio sp.]